MIDRVRCGDDVNDVYHLAPDLTPAGAFDSID
jgi:hypothetical protein